MYDWIIVNIFTRLCKYHSPQSNCGTYSSNQKEMFSHQQSFCIPTPSLTTSDQLPASSDLPTLDISCKWNHALFGPSWLESYLHFFFNSFTWDTQCVHQLVQSPDAGNSLSLKPGTGNSIQVSHEWQELNYLSHQSCLLCISRKLESGARASNRTQTVSCAMKAS